MTQPFIESELQDLQDKDLYRTLRSLEPVSGNRYLLNGREILLFCNNDYLGLSRHPRMIEVSKKALDQYGTGAGAARLISGSSDVHEKLEQAIASFKEKESALVFSAGYVANLGVVTALARETDLIVLDKLCHASVIDASRLSGAEIRVYPHRNYEKCEEILGKSESGRKKILVTDGVFSMDGDSADLAELVRMKLKYDCMLVVDDAHATGVSGKKGRGSYEDAGLAEHIDVVTGTLSKAAGCLGGFAAASKQIIEYLVNKSRPFIFATALPPVLCRAALEAFTMMKEDDSFRTELFRNLEIFTAKLKPELKPAERITFPIIPIILGSEKAALQAAADLLLQGYLVPAIRYPTVGRGKARLRVTLNALHKPKEIEAFAGALNRLNPQIEKE